MLACAIFGVLSVSSSSLLFAADSATAQTQRHYDVPAGGLDRALKEFASRSGVMLSADATLTAGKSSRGLRGNYTTEQGFATLLAGSGLAAVEDSSGSYSVKALPLEQSAAATRDGKVQSLGRIQVRDTAATDDSTEGTGSYMSPTVSLGKTPLSLRETPQSVSVVTRQRIEDQAITEVPDALRYVTGTNVKAGFSLYGDNAVTARGYDAAFQSDGIRQATGDGSQRLDLAVYDRVEVMRGPAGLFNSGGLTGATINLVRKRAHTDFQVGGLVNAGSWGSYRVEGDIAGSLAGSERAAGRLVAVTEDRGDWRDNVENEKQVVYGTVDIALSDHTTLSPGATWQQADSNNFEGLPAYSDGRLLNVSRSTSFATDWTGSDLETKDVFLDLEHNLDNGGLFKAVVRRTDTSNDLNFVGVAAGTSVTPEGLVTLRSRANGYGNEITSADSFFNTPFEVGGQVHNFLFGADYSRQLATRKIANATQYPIATVNIYDFSLSSIPEATYEEPFYDQETKTISYGGYTQLRIKPIEPLTLIGGARLAWWETESLDRLADTTTPGAEASSELTPYAAALFDIGPALSLYASYAEIFEPTTSTTVSGSVLEPRVGGQYEVGIKGEFFDRQLNMYTAVYRINDRNGPMADPDNSGFYIAAGKQRAQGFETEVSGQVTDRWNLTTGYTYTETKYLTATVTQQGKPFSTITPKHTFNLWTYYKLPESLLRGLDVGVGVRAMSDSYNESGTVRFEKAGYAIASLAFGYQINENLKASLNVENLFDKKYYERVQESSCCNLYGAPRSFMMNVRAKY